MHSKIFEIATKPIGEDDRLTSECLWNEDYSFCDYIGDEDDEETRLDDIACLHEIMRDIFDLEDDHLVYKGLGSFYEDWDKYISGLASNLNDSLMHSVNMHRIKMATEETHLECAFRFYIDEWNGWPGPTADLIEFVNHSLKPGDKLYIGSVIDYHF